MVITEQDSKHLIRALSLAEGLPKGVSAPTAPCCVIEFLQGTNSLGAVAVQEEWFSTGDGEYVEKSGALKAVQRRLETDETAHRAWVNQFAQDVKHKPEFVNLQSWSIETLQRNLDRTGELNYREFPMWLEAAIRAARVSAPRISLLQSPSRQAEALVFDWQHYGLLVGASNYLTTFQAWYITNVAPGIYAYHNQR